MNIPDLEFITVPHYLHELSGYPNIGWIYRGQADATRPLVPKAGRPEFFLPETGKPETVGLPPRDICRFNYWRQLAIAYEKRLPLNDFECLAFAQHYGLATRLLDWSTNPLAALFFSVDSCSDCDGAVFCHSPNGHIDAKVAVLGSFPYIGQYTPPPFDTRILLQSGVFTYHPAPNEPLTAMPVQDLGPLTPEHGANLVRLVVKRDIKPILKRQLDEIGVNRKSLFPDLDGLSDFVNWGTQRSASRA